MGKNNNTKIVKILIIIFIIIILIIGCLFIFLTTDIFKSNKILFMKYASQLASKENSLIEDNVIEYYGKILETPFENSTSLSFNASSNIGENQKLINQANISINGRMDIKNKNIEETANINYSPTVTLPINLRYKDNLFGYQTEYIGAKYIVDDRENSSSIISDINSNENNEENANEKENLTKKDIEDIVKKYGEIALEQVPEGKFTKENEEETTVYKLEITQADIVNIEKAVLEELKQDQETMDKLKLEEEKITDYLETVQEGDVKNSESNIEIALYKTRGAISKLTVEVGGKANISLEKTKNGSTLQYKITIASEAINAELNVSYNGLKDLQNIVDSYSLKLSKVNNGTEEDIITYNLNNKIDFVDNVNIESFNDNNAVIYSKYNQDQINSFAQAVNERMEQVNQMQMGQLGLTDQSQNPILLAIMLPLSNIIAMPSNDNVTSQQDLTQQVDVNVFNQKFELYQGTNIQGTTVRGLLTTISSNNGIQENDYTTTQTNIDSNSNYKIKEINFNGEEYEVNQQNIAALKEEIIPENYYRVEFEKEMETGLIYRVVITPK